MARPRRSERYCRPPTPSTMRTGSSTATSRRRLPVASEGELGRVSERVARREVSGLSAAAFAVRERIAVKSLAWWRWRLRSPAGRRPQLPRYGVSAGGTRAGSGTGAPARPSEGMADEEQEGAWDRNKDTRPAEGAEPDDAVATRRQASQGPSSITCRAEAAPQLPQRLSLLSASTTLPRHAGCVTVTYSADVASSRRCHPPWSAPSRPPCRRALPPQCAQSPSP